jgi:hypothetical protein
LEPDRVPRLIDLNRTAPICRKFPFDYFSTPPSLFLATKFCNMACLIFCFNDEKEESARRKTNRKRVVVCCSRVLVLHWLNCCWLCIR